MLLSTYGRAASNFQRAIVNLRSAIGNLWSNEFSHRITKDELRPPITKADGRMHNKWPSYIITSNKHDKHSSWHTVAQCSFICIVEVSSNHGSNIDPPYFLVFCFLLFFPQKRNGRKQCTQPCGRGSSSVFSFLSFLHQCAPSQSYSSTKSL